jgi:hypothetical protein
VREVTKVGVGRPPTAQVATGIGPWSVMKKMSAQFENKIFEQGSHRIQGASYHSFADESKFIVLAMNCELW